MNRRSFLEVISATFAAGAAFVPSPTPPLSNEHRGQPATAAELTLSPEDAGRFDIWHYAHKLDANAAPITLPFDLAVARMRAEFVLQLELMSIQLVIGGYPVFAGPLTHYEDGEFRVYTPRLSSVLLIPAGQSIELQSKGGACTVWLEGLMNRRPARGPQPVPFKGA